MSKPAFFTARKHRSACRVATSGASAGDDGKARACRRMWHPGGGANMRSVIGRRGWLVSGPGKRLAPRPAGTGIIDP